MIVKKSNFSKIYRFKFTLLSSVMFNCSNSEINKINSNIEKTTLKLEEVSNILNESTFAFDIDFLETEDDFLDENEVKNFKLKYKEFDKNKKNYSFNECGFIMYFLRNNLLDKNDIKNAFDVLVSKLESILSPDEKCIRNIIYSNGIKYLFTFIDFVDNRLNENKPNVNKEKIECFLKSVLKYIYDNNLIYDEHIFFDFCKLISFANEKELYQYIESGKINDILNSKLNYINTKGNLKNDNKIEFLFKFLDEIDKNNLNHYLNCNLIQESIKEAFDEICKGSFTDEDQNIFNKIFYLQRKFHLNLDLKSKIDEICDKFDKDQQISYSEYKFLLNILNNREAQNLYKKEIHNIYVQKNNKKNIDNKYLQQLKKETEQNEKKAMETIMEKIIAILENNSIMKTKDIELLCSLKEDITDKKQKIEKKTSDEVSKISDQVKEGKIKSIIKEDEEYLQKIFNNKFYYNFSKDIPLISKVIVLHTIKLAIERNKNIEIVFKESFKDDTKGGICFILHDYDKEFIPSKKFNDILKNTNFSNSDKNLDEKEKNNCPFVKTFDRILSLNFDKETLYKTDFDKDILNTNFQRSNLNRLVINKKYEFTDDFTKHIIGLSRTTLHEFNHCLFHVLNYIERKDLKEDSNFFDIIYDRKLDNLQDYDTQVIEDVKEYIYNIPSMSDMFHNQSNSKRDEHKKTYTHYSLYFHDINAQKYIDYNESIDLVHSYLKKKDDYYCDKFVNLLQQRPFYEYLDKNNIQLNNQKIFYKTIKGFFYHSNQDYMKYLSDKLDGDHNHKLYDFYINMKKNNIDHKNTLQFETFCFQYLSKEFEFKSFLDFLNKNNIKIEDSLGLSEEYLKYLKFSNFLHKNDIKMEKLTDTDKYKKYYEDFIKNEKQLNDNEEQLNDSVSSDFNKYEDFYKYEGYFYYFYSSMKNKDIDYDNLVKEVVEKRTKEIDELKKNISDDEKKLQNLNIGFNKVEGMADVFSICNTGVFLPSKGMFALNYFMNQYLEKFTSNLEKQEK